MQLETVNNRPLIPEEEDLPGGKWLIKCMAKEFLEERLGIPATQKNIRRFAAHIILFEKQLEYATKKKKHAINQAL